MTGRAAPLYRNMPYHLRRYITNRSAFPVGHFSMLSEVLIEIIAPLEEVGYTLPDRLLPDISSGKLFSQLLRDELGINTDAMPYYNHHFEDGRVVRARAYSEEFQPLFKRFLRERWIPESSQSYFEGRDPKAVPFLQMIRPKQTH